METTTPRHALGEIRALAARRNAPLLLELDLTVDPLEGAVDDPLSALPGRRRQTLREIVDGLRRAALDPRTRVLVAHIASSGMPLARAQEIRDAVAEFRSAGKFAIARADTFGEFGGGTVPYYLACAFDQIWLAPPGDLGLTGIASHTPFLREALDRLGVTTELGARHEYKNAVNTFVERGFTPAHLEATTRVVESCADEVIAGIVAGRQLPSDRVRALVDAGPLSARAALGAGLVDRLGYRDEVYAAARLRAAAADPTAQPAAAGLMPSSPAAGATGTAKAAEAVVAAASAPPSPSPPPRSPSPVTGTETGAPTPGSPSPASSTAAATAAPSPAAAGGAPGSAASERATVDASDAGTIPTGPAGPAGPASVAGGAVLDPTSAVPVGGAQNARDAGGTGTGATALAGAAGDAEQAGNEPSAGTPRPAAAAVTAGSGATGEGNTAAGPGPAAAEAPGADGSPAGAGSPAGVGSPAAGAGAAADGPVPGPRSASGPGQGTPAKPAPVPMYLGAYGRSAARRDDSPSRRVVRSLAAVGSRLAAQRRDARPTAPRESTVPATGAGPAPGVAAGPAPGIGAGLALEVAVPPALDASRAAVALIHGTGPVVPHRAGPPFGAPVLAADAVCAAFRAAAKDPDIAAAVFRVDSPGGSYVASDLVRREVERFRATGRPVVVSMGSVAASGGYFVSLAADTIVANPSTLTGSIGVYGGKQVISGLLDKLGVAIGEVAQGEHALMMSARRPFSPGERAKLDEFLDRVYDDFVGKVATARAMSVERVHELARGRVWTGADAHRHGLVDELGGLERALRLAWSAAGLPGARPGRVRLVPRRSLVDRVRPARSSDDPAAAAQVAFGAGGLAALGTGRPGGAVAAVLEALGGGPPATASGGAGAYALAGGWEALVGCLAGVLTGDHAGGWGPLAGLAASLGLPSAGPLVMPPVGPIY